MHWTKFYKQDENAQNAIISYYTKGALFALYLDLTLRSETQGKYNLDHVMQIFMAGICSARQRHDWQLSPSDCRATPRPWLPRFVCLLDNTDDIPLFRCFAEFGVEFNLRASQGPQDVGGGQAKGYDIALARKLKRRRWDWKWWLLPSCSPAHLAGLSGDTLIAADNFASQRARSRSYSNIRWVNPWIYIGLDGMNWWRVNWW